MSILFPPPLNPDTTELSRRAAERHAQLAAITERRSVERRSAPLRRRVGALPSVLVVHGWLRRRMLS